MKPQDKYKVNLPHFDAAANVLFTNQLVQTLAGTFNTKFAELKGKLMVPVDNSIAPYIETVRWEQFDTQGPDAKALAGQDWQNDLPQVNGSGAENFQRMQSYGLAFGYNEQELLATAHGGQPIDQLRALAVRRGLASKLDDIAAVGDSSRSLLGLMNQTNTATYTATSSWAAGTTADLLLADLNGLCDKAFVDTKEVEFVKRIVMPTAFYRLIETKARSTTSDLTVLEYFKRNNPGIQVMSWERLSSIAGAGGSGARVIAYNPDPLNVRMLLSVEFEAKPPQQRNMGFVVNCHMRSGGVISPFPKSIVYMDV